MVKKLLINLLFLSLLAFSANAQVTVGSATPPADYAVLQIDGIGGLRLPKLTQTERDALELTFTSTTEGVVIYFDGGTPDTSYFQFWDGSQWISMKYISNVVNSENGITDLKATLGDVVNVSYGLGGQLTEDTKLTQVTPTSGVSLLKFDPNNGGRFTVMDNALVVSADAVGIGTTPSGTAILEITSDTEGEAFRYQATNPQDKYVLASDADGYASWVDLTPNIIEKDATILSNVNIGTTNLTDSKQISSELELEKGIWLIMARYVAQTQTRLSSTNAPLAWGKNAWLTLNKSENSTLTEIVRVGQIPQLMDRYMTTTPQLIYILNVPATAKYVLYGSMMTTSAGVTSDTRVLTTDTNSGKSYFKAIQLSDDPSY